MVLLGEERDTLAAGSLGVSGCGCCSADGRSADRAAGCSLSLDSLIASTPRPKTGVDPALSRLATTPAGVVEVEGRESLLSPDDPRRSFAGLGLRMFPVAGGGGEEAPGREIEGVRVTKDGLG